MPRSFELVSHGQVELFAGEPLLPGPPGNSLLSERGLELAIARLWLEGRPPAYTLEVGCVTPYYWPSDHRVIDLCDQHPRAANQDVRSVTDWAGLHVLSISTLEHVEADITPIIRDILTQAESCLITVPLGWRTDVDATMRVVDFAALNATVCHYRRLADRSWSLITDGKYCGTYHTPLPYANDVVFIWTSWPAPRAEG